MRFDVITKVGILRKFLFNFFCRGCSFSFSKIPCLIPFFPRPPPPVPSLLVGILNVIVRETLHYPDHSENHHTILPMKNKRKGSGQEKKANILDPVGMPYKGSIRRVDIMHHTLV